MRPHISYAAGHVRLAGPHQDRPHRRPQAGRTRAREPPLAIWIPDPATRAQRQLLRGRVFLVRQRTVMRNRIHAWLTTVELAEVARRQVDLILANHALLTTQIHGLDRTSRTRSSATHRAATPDYPRHRSLRSFAAPGRDRAHFPLPLGPGARRLRGPRAQHAEFRRQDPAGPYHRLSDQPPGWIAP